MPTQPITSSTLSSQLHRLPSQPLTQFLSQRPLSPISTSVTNFDYSLGGGIVPGQIYEISGLNGSGKTSLASQLCINALKMNKKTIWITTVKGFPLSKVETIKENEPELDSLEQLKHIHLNTSASLFLFLHSLTDSFGLLIIEDLSTLLDKSFAGTGEALSKRSKDSISNKRNRSIQDFMKMLSSYCTQKKAACCIFNPVEILNMSFVETSNELRKPPSSSGSLHSSQIPFSMPKPKLTYQSILVSSLGDHPSWTSYIRARIMLYKDWSTGSSTATYVHIKHSPMMKRILQYRNYTPKVVSFTVKNEGIEEVDKNSVSVDVTRSFMLNEDELFSSDMEHEEGENEEIASSTLLNSSPRHGDIQLAKDLLPSTLTNTTSANTIEEGRKDVFGKEEEQLEKETNLHVNDEGSANKRGANGESIYSHGVSIPHGPDHEVHDSEVKEDNVLGNSEKHTGNSEDGDDEGGIDHEDTMGSTQSDEEPNADDLTKLTDEHPQCILEQVDSIPHNFEIDDELEELYPSQPESLSIVQLSQFPLKRIHDTTLLKESMKRAKIPPVNSFEFTQDAHKEDTDSQEDHIPASEPYF